VEVEVHKSIRARSQARSGQSVLELLGSPHGLRGHGSPRYFIQSRRRSHATWRKRDRPEGS